MKQMPLVHFTPLERLIDDFRTALLLRVWYQNEEFEARAMREIKAKVEFANRSLGQQYRYTAARLRANFQGDSHAK